MQVSHVADHCTHAVIGGAENIEFGISNSAEFFNILSSTLYTDQKLAVAREVLCNAWDAHVEQGITDRPVIITLNTEKFSVQDFGKGIAREFIGPIYGTYGNSTKKHDGKQTGGFGLGCKAPFAYTDHFEVTSAHAGVKTIYNMSKSAAQVQGKPGIIPIASFPTTETGITVSLDLKTPQDMANFKELVQRIARNGEMNVELNGEKVQTIPFSTMQHDFMVTTDDVYPGVSHKVFVRYGNVIYPVENHGDYSSQLSKVLEFLNRLPDARYTAFRIIFQAPAHSISVTPSRESLSMQEHTIRTLKDLFDAFLKRLGTELEGESYRVMRERVVAAATVTGKTGELFRPAHELPGSMGGTAIPVKFQYMAEINKLANACVQKTYPQYQGFRKADILQRIQTMLDNQLGPRGLLQTFRAAYEKESRTKGKEDPGSWFHRNLAAPLLAKLPEELSAERLLVCGHGVGSGHWYGREKSEIVTQLAKADRLGMEMYLPYLRNLIVISYSRLDVEDRVKKFPLIKDTNGMATGYLLYVCPRSQKRVDAAREFFTKEGFTVLDLTVSQPWEAASTVAVVERAPAKPKKKGFPCWSTAVRQDKVTTIGRCRDDDADRIDQPEWYARLPKKDRDSRYPAELGVVLDQSHTLTALRLFGSSGAVTSQPSQEDQLRLKGVKSFDEYVIEKVCAYVQQSPAIAEYLQFRLDQVYAGAGYNKPKGYNIYRMCMKVERLRKEFSLLDNRTPEDRKYLSLYVNLIERAAYSTARSSNPLILAAKKYMDGIPVNPGALALKAKLSGNAMLGILDVTAIIGILNEDPQPGNAAKQAQIDSTLKILLIAIQG